MSGASPPTAAPAQARRSPAAPALPSPTAGALPRPRKPRVKAVRLSAPHAPGRQGLPHTAGDHRAPPHLPSVPLRSMRRPGASATSPGYGQHPATPACLHRVRGAATAEAPTNPGLGWGDPEVAARSHLGAKARLCTAAPARLPSRLCPPAPLLPLPPHPGSH